MPPHPTPATERVWSRVDIRSADECWPWTGKTLRSGYGSLLDGGRARPAHRVAYEAAVGPVVDELVIDHLCRNRLCCNPAHLEPVTDAENILRGESPSALNARKATCPRGHPYDFRSPRGWRRCTTCDNDAQRRRRNRKRTRTPVTTERTFA